MPINDREIRLTGPRAWIARGYVLIVGIVALLMATEGIVTLVSAVSAGCWVNLGLVSVSVQIGGTAQCQYNIDAGSPILALSLGILLLLTARRLGRVPLAWGRVVPLGMVGGIVAALFALSTAIWLVQFYRLSGPLEIGIGSLPLVWALASAAIVWWHAQAERSRR